MAEIKISELIQQYRNAYPEARSLTDEEILSVINNSASEINLNDDEKISAFGLHEQGYNGLALEYTKQEPEESSIGIAALAVGAGAIIAGLLSRGKIKAGILGKSAKIYKTPRKIKFETVATKVNNNPEFESNPICKHLLYRFQSQHIPKKEKQKYLTMLDMVAENKILNSNKNLMYLFDKFLKNDKSVMSDILQRDAHGHLAAYYSGLPESIIGKELSELNPAELKAVKQWLYRCRESVPKTNLLREFYPSIPSYAEDFPAFVKQIKKLESIDSTPLKPENLQMFNETLLNLTKSNEGGKITSLIPELFPKGKGISESSLKLLQKISKSENFQKLSNEDKRILIMSTILQDTKGDAKTIMSCCERLGFKRVDSEKIVNITKYSNLGEDFMKTTKKSITYEVHGGEIVTNNRHEFFDNAAFDLKEENTFELAQMLYSSKCQKGLTRNLDKMLSKKINEFKAGDFMMPQTPRELYISKAQPMTIVRRGKSYNVRVVKRSEIGEFYAYCHTPINVSARKDASVIQNISKLELQASETMSDRVICTCFVDSKSKCFVSNIYDECFAQGFIGQIPNCKQYVGAGADLGSLAKDKRSLIQHYYNDNGVYLDYASRLNGAYMPDVRKITACNLKKELNISNSEYVKRMDKIKKALGDEPLSIEKLQTIDPEMAAAYKNFLSRRIGDGSKASEAVLRADHDWNEFLCSEFKISDIYTTDVNRLSPEFLEMAANSKNDMVIISMFE